jgi:hypothetical protein
MANYYVVVPHALGQEEALARLQRFLEDIERQYAPQVSDVRGEWEQNRLEFGFVASGLSIDGAMVVEHEVVEVSGPLPLIAAMFRGRIEQTIRDELARLLH